MFTDKMSGELKKRRSSQDLKLVVDKKGLNFKETLKGINEFLKGNDDRNAIKNFTSLKKDPKALDSIRQSIRLRAW